MVVTPSVGAGIEPEFSDRAAQTYLSSPLKFRLKIYIIYPF